MVDDLDRCYAWVSVHGQPCPVTRILDIDGEDLGEEAELWQACKIVVQTPDGRWAVFAVDYSYLRALN